ncbi:MAG: cbb3-type cytochrome c oxidase N-terminal domain-containing protein [Ferruginibacter sp.]
MNKKIALTVLMVVSGFTIMAQDATVVKTVASGNNLLATLLIITAVALLFVIYGMGQALITLSRHLLDKNKSISTATGISVVVILSLFSQNAMAQELATGEVVKIIPNYGGLSATTFYFLVAVIATEVMAILFLYFSIRRIYIELVPAKAAVIVKQSRMADLWVKLDKKLFTKAIPIEQEADALLDHNYDGIQELDNALPPWWKYGFIITILFAVVYLLNFHVFGNGKNPTQEYAAEMYNAQIAKEEYEAKNKDKIDESNVPMADATGLKNGKEYYSANCVACHGALGEGGAGPNLTDDYWLHKGSLNDVYNTIKKGYPDKGMQSWAIKFNPKEISELASFVKTLKGTNPPNGKAPQGDPYKENAGGDSSKVISNQVTIK